MNEPIEQEIQRKGLNAPRITPNDVEGNVVQENYFTAYDGATAGGARLQFYGKESPRHDEALKMLTFCVLVLKNGFTVTGESACASPENFDAQIGRKIARENALQKIWPLMGYELRTKLSQQPQ